MSEFKLVDINSAEFKKVVMKIIEEGQNVNSLQNKRFMRLSDNLIRDLELNIEWGLSSSNSMNYKDAQEYAESKGGRLPSIKELQSLVDYDKHEPAIDINVFSDTKQDWYWTSVKTAWRKDAAWGLSFDNGRVGSYYGDNNGYVRPVRASQ